MLTAFPATKLAPAGPRLGSARANAFYAGWADKLTYGVNAREVAPLGVVVFFLLVGLRRPRRWPLATALAALWAFGAPCVADAFLWTLESRYPPVDNARCVPADAIVVLGGILRFPESTIAPFEWSDSANRFEKGVDLLSAGKARYLVFTGAKFTDAPAVPSEGEMLRQIAGRLRGALRSADGNSPASAAGGASCWSPPPTTCRGP